MAVKLTDKMLKALQPGEKAVELRDSEVRGLIYRLQPSGVATFYLQYRDGAGKTCRYRIGRFGEIGLPAARAAAKKELARITFGDSPAEEKREARTNLTLKEFLDGPYNDWALQNLKSYASVKKRTRHGFVPLLEKRLADLTPFDFEKNRVARLKDKKRKPATVNRDQMTLRAALTKAVQWGLINENPLDKVKRSKEDRNAAIRAITPDEEEKVRRTFKAQRSKWFLNWSLENKQRKLAGKPRPPLPPFYQSYLEPCFWLSLDTGIRAGEARALQWADIDLDSGFLTVRGSGAKSSQSRRIPLTKRARKTLERWRKQTDGDGAVFGGATEDSLRWQWANLRKDAGISSLRWHDLRHSYASRLAHAGAGVLMIKELLGHSSIATSQRYMHAVESDLLRAVDLLERASAASKAQKRESKHEAQG